MFKKLSILMLLAVVMVTKSEEPSRDKDYQNSDETTLLRKHKCKQFCSVNIRNILTLAGVNINNVLGIAGVAGINGQTAAVGLVDANGAQTASGGAAGLGLTAFANYYSSATTNVLDGQAVPFASSGPVSATGITRSNVGTANTNFVLSAVGTYEVTFFGNYIPTTDPQAQISLYISNNNGASFALVPQAIFGSLFDNIGPVFNTKIIGTALVTTTVPNTLLQARNTTGNGTSLTPSVNTGDPNNSIAGLIIKRIA